DYLSRGYRAGAAGGATGRAIGFVMTTYRKLASSSIAAIERALEHRLTRLERTSPPPPPRDQSLEEEIAEGGDDQDDLAERDFAVARTQFFDQERDMLEGLLFLARSVRAEDEKLRILLDH